MSETESAGTQRERQGAFDHLIPRGERRRLGELVRQARIDAGLQQGDLAAALDVSQAVISKIEAGDRGLTVLELLVICAGLGISWEYILQQLEHERPSR
ncbi:MAG: helix-turn-helix transcriptional regulator [Chloroflexia bacterium]|nr:helix-turn-helix transcriptional regulator [Chloroflexia bacterium]